EALATGLIDWKGGRHEASLLLRPQAGAPLSSAAQVPDYLIAVRQTLKLLHDNGLPPAGGAVSAAGHRVVHGGPVFRRSVRIDAEVRQAIGRLAELAPLHNPPALEVIHATEAALPGVPQVAAFDTTFFAALPAEQFVYPLPYEWYTDWGVRRF